MALNPDLLKRVTYSKYLLRRAKDLHRRGHELNSAEAVLAAHDAAEMLMRVVTDFSEVKAEQDFMAFWQAVLVKTGTSAPDKGQMDRFNKVRTEFKHRGILPNMGVVSDLLPVVESFCKEISLKFLSQDYDEISLADLIRSDDVRKKMKEAEEAKGRNDFPAAMTSLGIAFDLLLRDANIKHRWSLLEYRWSKPSIHIHEVQQILSLVKLEEISKGVENVTDAVNMLLLGIDPLKFNEFSKVTPLRQWSVAGEPLIVWTHGATNLTAESYDKAYQFVLDSGLKISA